MMRGMWNRETAALLLALSYMPMAVMWVRYDGIDAVLSLFFVVLIAAVWHLVFLLVRAQTPSLSVLGTALAIAVLVPEELGPFRMILGVSFGIVLGELIFGGWGRNVVHPAVVTLAFLGFGFPSFPWPEILLPIAWAAIPVALFGVLVGVMPGPVILGAVIVGAAAVALEMDVADALPAASVVLVLLIADPVTSATTTLGRWMNGVLFGLLVVMFALNWNGAEPVQIAISAALLTSLAAPLLDEASIALWRAKRRRRHGRT